MSRQLLYTSLPDLLAVRICTHVVCHSVPDTIQNQRTDQHVLCWVNVVYLVPLHTQIHRFEMTPPSNCIFWSLQGLKGCCHNIMVTARKTATKLHCQAYLQTKCMPHQLLCCWTEKCHHWTPLHPLLHPSLTPACSPSKLAWIW